MVIKFKNWENTDINSGEELMSEVCGNLARTFAAQDAWDKMSDDRIITVRSTVYIGKATFIALMKDLNTELLYLVGEDGKVQLSPDMHEPLKMLGLQMLLGAAYINWPYDITTSLIERRIRNIEKDIDNEHYDSAKVELNKLREVDELEAVGLQARLDTLEFLANHKEKDGE